MTNEGELIQLVIIGTIVLMGVIFISALSLIVYSLFMKGKRSKIESELLNKKRENGIHTTKSKF